MDWGKEHSNKPSQIPSVDFYKGTESIHWGIVTSAMGNWISTCKRRRLYLYLTYTKINKMNQRSNIRIKMIKL